MIKSYTYDMIEIGQKAEFSKTITDADIVLFAGVTGDMNPVHINQEWASKSFFKTRIAHGMLTAGLISTVLGTKLPGPGTIYLKQTLEFIAPVMIGDTITAIVEVTEKLEKGRVKFRTLCKNQNDKIVLQGEAEVLPPKNV